MAPDPMELMQTEEASDEQTEATDPTRWHSVLRWRVKHSTWWESQKECGF